MEKKNYVLLFWEEIGETSTNFLIPEEKAMLDVIKAGNGYYINDHDWSDEPERLKALEHMNYATHRSDWIIKDGSESTYVMAEESGVPREVVGLWEPFIIEPKKGNPFSIPNDVNIIAVVHSGFIL